MIAKFLRPFFWLSILMLIASGACGPTPQATEIPTREVVVEASPTPTNEPEPSPEPEEPATLVVSSLEDIKKATIQIEAQGSFVDPEFGAVFNVAGRGSGFIIDPSGIAVTNNHVVTGAALLKVWVGGDTSQTYNAKVLGVSECSDLAVVDIDGDGYNYVEWFEDPVRVGLEVYAAGFPLGDPEFTLTKGIVSKEKADGETSWASVDAVVEHDATINPGNSGGPLVSKEGKVVGINYAGASERNQYFAIGQPVAVPLINDLRAGNDVDSIGINGQVVMTSDGSLSGIWVSSVKSGSPADQSGLTGGDIITSMEGLDLGLDGTMSQYCDILRTHNTDDTLSIEVLRWLSGEFLGGQLNGRPLEVGATFSTGGSGQEVSGDSYGEYVLVTDDTASIQLEIPSVWVEIDGREWEADWGRYGFTSPSISAAASLENYISTYDESGVFFAASRRLGEIGGYVQLLDGMLSWHEGNCSKRTRQDYGYGEFEDPWYEGKFDYWENCGSNGTSVVVLAARPKDDRTSYLLILEMTITKEADWEAFDRILSTFQANF